MSLHLIGMGSLAQIRVGSIPIGGDAPVVVQSMTLTKTHDVEATTAQIAALVSAGCEVVRCAVPKIEDADALARIVRLSPIPVIAASSPGCSIAVPSKPVVVSGGVSENLADLAGAGSEPRRQ